jgi:hypothetical protein
MAEFLIIAQLFDKILSEKQLLYIQERGRRQRIVRIGIKIEAGDIFSVPVCRI